MKKQCWGETKKSINCFPNRDYFVNTEKGVSYWGKPVSDTDILPAGWEYVYSTSGALFYYNHSLKKATFNEPTEKDKLPVPKGWKEMRSKNCNNVYYMDSETSETQWDYPREKQILTKGSKGDHKEKRFGVSLDLKGKIKKSANKPGLAMKLNNALLTKQNRDLYSDLRKEHLKEKEELREAIKDYKTIAKEQQIRNAELELDLDQKREQHFQEIEEANKRENQAKLYYAGLLDLQDEIKDETYKIFDEAIERENQAKLEYANLQKYHEAANKQLRTQKTHNDKLHEQVRYLAPKKFNMEMDPIFYDARRFVQKDLQQKIDTEKILLDYEDELHNNEWDKYMEQKTKPQYQLDDELAQQFKPVEETDDEDESPDYTTVDTSTKTLQPSHFDSDSDEVFSAESDDEDFQEADEADEDDEDFQDADEDIHPADYIGSGGLEYDAERVELRRKQQEQELNLLSELHQYRLKLAEKED